MCRLFGFKSVINSQVHTSLVHAENALGLQSLKHPDGWGVAYYLESVPHLIKSVDKAIDDHIFHKVSGVVSSQTVVAHIRKATHGEKNILNSHPFQYGKWIFAHNGNLKEFEKYKKDLIKHIDKELHKFVLGSTDSEIIFALILSELKKIHALDKDDIPPKDLKTAVEKAFQLITKHSGPLCDDENPDPSENHLTIILTSGKTMVAFNGGQHLHYSTYKSKCSERDTCPYFDPICEKKAQEGDKVNHLIFSSEVLQGENKWLDVKKGELIGTDASMVLFKENLNVDFEKTKPTS